MAYIEIILLALALSIDACVVSFSYGLIFDKNKLKNALLLALFTGGFQGIMPCFGYYLTNIIKTYIAPYSKIIIFTIFIFLGIKFIKDALENKKEKPLCISLNCLFLIGIATSIDAFSAGISLALYDNNIFYSALIISVITAVNSLLGFLLGNKLKNFPSKIMEIIAGIILIILGIKAIL